MTISVAAQFLDAIEMITLSPEPSPDQKAAHHLLSELRTRIATQVLPYQHGVEARALESLWEVFALAREAMKDNPGCAQFARAATRILNVELRPFTAKWHRAHALGVLSSRDGSNEFRADLALLRPKLEAFCLDLQEMAYGGRNDDEQPPPVMGQAEVDLCFAHVRFGIGQDRSIANAADIDAAEHAEVAARRAKFHTAAPESMDAVGLALSGGGIRSATFCLGVVQVLVKRRLIQDFDYLSTVSGGGYTGSFVTDVVGHEDGFASVGMPHGPDTDAVRRLRRKAKYLSAVDLRERWTMVTGTIAGTLLNWTAPFSVLASLAMLCTFAEPTMAARLAQVVAALALLTILAMLTYGISLRFDRCTRIAGRGLAWTAGAGAVVLLLLAVERGYDLFLRALDSQWSVSGSVALLAVSLPAAVRYLPVFRKPASRVLALKAALVLAGVAAPFLGLLVYYALRRLGSLPEDIALPAWNPLHHASGFWVLATCAIGSAVFAGLFLDVNLTGPHRLYRDRLARTFVPHGAEGAQTPLSGVNATGSAPYHLLCATVNLPSSTSDVLRERHGDFFLFSKHWCGSPSTGYVETTKWRADTKQIDLATAMAISGAAASPQMGLGSVQSLSALLTLLNIRLGYWIARPGSGAVGVPGFICLLREMTGTSMSEANRWLNLSDGGHIENMGVYELLRRRCKFIVCVDGEADPKSLFSGQLTLVRHAQIDFGVRIEPRLDDIRRDSRSGYSRAHSQLFRVRYPGAGAECPEEMGLLLYLKLSMTGDEDELLKGYRSLHPEFPHQSTLDQFYDEEQFEAYRQLGVHVAEGAFAPALLTEDPRPATVASWFRQLAVNMLEPSRK